MLEPLFRCNLACVGCGKIDYPDADPEQAPVGQGMPRRGRRMRRADGGDPGRRAADPQGDRRDRQGHRRAQEVRLALHQRAAAREEAASVRAVALSVLLGPSRRPQGASRQVGVPGRRVRARGLGDQGREGEGLHRQRQRDDLRRPSGRGHRGVPRFRPRSSASASRSRPATPTSARPTRSTSSTAARPRSCSATCSRSARARTGTSCTRACSSTSSPATRPTTARRGACRRATSSAGRSPAICSAKAMSKTFKELMETTDWDTYGTGNYEKCANCMAHCGYEPTAATATLQHPLKAMRVALRGARTEGPMAPEISLENQRPAQYVFSEQVQKKLSEIRSCRGGRARQRRTASRGRAAHSLTAEPRCGNARPSRALSKRKSRSRTRRPDRTRRRARHVKLEIARESSRPRPGPSSPLPRISAARAARASSDMRTKPEDRADTHQRTHHGGKVVGSVGARAGERRRGKCADTGSITTRIAATGTPCSERRAPRHGIPCRPPARRSFRARRACLRRRPAARQPREQPSTGRESCASDAATSADRSARLACRRE